ncbi:MAG: NADH:flavin oxidoreductase [Bacteroidota bacterium]
MSNLFTPLKIGPIELRNRSIRAAAFEGMCPNHNVSNDLINYHSNIAAGGIGMTTVAYASVSKNGLSFSHQMWIRKDIIPSLKELTYAIQSRGAKASIQLGHCGNMAKYRTIKSRAIAPSAIPNLYAMTFPREMQQTDINEIVNDFKQATKFAIEAGFDAVEVHAGHGYLISQFLSPYTNHRTDTYGGSLVNRMRFMEEVLNAVLEEAKDKIAVLVKMNMRDGFKGGLEKEESLVVAKKLQELGVNALVLSGGFVSKSPMYVMKGAMPFNTLAAHIDETYLRFFIKRFGQFLVKQETFSENYFLEEAIYFRQNLQLPLIYIGGVLSEKNIEEVLMKGFDGVAMARCLIENPNFILDIKNKTKVQSACNTCNHCIACIYNNKFECSLHL